VCIKLVLEKRLYYEARSEKHQIILRISYASSCFFFTRVLSKLMLAPVNFTRAAAAKA